MGWFKKDVNDEMFLFCLLFCLVLVTWWMGAPEISKNVASGMLGGILMYMRGGNAPPPS